MRRFADIADYEVGRTPARANARYWTNSDDDVPWVTISDIPAYGNITKTKESVSRAAFDEIFHGTAVPAGTLLMSFKLTIGRVATLDIPAVHNEAIISIRPKPGVDQRFLAYYLSQVDYSQLQDRQIKGNTLNKSKIDRIPVPVPPEQEQKAIVGVLDAAREAIESNRAALDVATDLKRVASTTLFARGLRGEALKESDIGPLPESWSVASLGSLGRIGNGSTPKRSTDAYWNGGAFPWLTSAKVYDREINDAEEFVTDTALAECHLPKVQPGAVLMAITGQGKTLGHVAVLNIEAAISQHLAYIQTDTDRAEPAFVRGYLETQYDALRQVAAGGGSTKGALTCAFLRELSVPVPALPEQREIAQALDALDQKIALHRNKLALLEELFGTLLDKLMSQAVSVDGLVVPVRTAPEGSAA
jgi:type I restriction enzyme S subunit